MTSITRVENTNGKNFSHRRTQTNIIEAKIQLADYHVHYRPTHTYTAKKSFKTRRPTWPAEWEVRTTSTSWVGEQTIPHHQQLQEQLQHGYRRPGEHCFGLLALISRPQA